MVKIRNSTLAFASREGETLAHMLLSRSGFRVLGSVCLLTQRCSLRLRTIGKHFFEQRGAECENVLVRLCALLRAGSLSFADFPEQLLPFLVLFFVPFDRHSRLRVEPFEFRLVHCAVETVLAQKFLPFRTQ